MSDPHDDPIDRDLAEGFTQLRPPEDLVSKLLHATHPVESQPTPIVRILPGALLLAAVAAVALLVLGARPSPPTSIEPSETPAAPLTIPAGMRAVTVPVPQQLVGDDDLVNGALADLISLQNERTVTLIEGALVITAAPNQLTVACTPDQAEVLVLALEHGPLVPSFHQGDRRRVTVPISGTPVDPTFLAEMRTDVLATMHDDDGTLETITFLTDVPIERAYADGRVTLGVGPRQAERLLHTVERGPLSLSLRGR